MPEYSVVEEVVIDADINKVFNTMLDVNNSIDRRLSRWERWIVLFKI